MTFQYIINHLHEPHLWCIVLTAPHAELNIQKETGTTRVYHLCSNDFSSAQLGRMYKRNTHPTIARCVFVYATKEEMQEMQKEYTALSLQTVTALYQSQ